MRYLRMLSNSAFAGTLAAVYLTLLVLHLNPAVPGGSAMPLATVMSVTYGAHIAVLSYVLYALRQIAVGEPSTPGWISLRLLTWSAAGLSAAAALVAWLHATGLSRTLDPQAFPGITRAALAWAVAAVSFLVLGVAQTITRDRGRAAVAILFTMVTVGSIAVPLALRSGAEAPSPRRHPAVASSVDGAGLPRVILLCLDGASLDVISPAVAAGRLPNFSRILDRGASLHLATTRPTHPETAWASVITGKWPAAHGVRATARYQPYTGGPPLDVLPDYLFSQLLVRFGFVVEQPHTSLSLRAWPLWDVVAEQRIASGIVALPLTYPAQPLPGFLISDAFYRNAWRAAELEVEPAVYPAAVEETARAVLATVNDGRQPMTADRVHHRLAAELASRSGVRLLAVRYSGIDAVGHYYTGSAQQPDPFRQRTEEDRRARERALADYYAAIDVLVGDAIAMLGPGDLLVVVSAFGMEPITLGKRIVERTIGDARVIGSHERAPDGFALAYGDPVAAGRLPRGTVVDLVPTLLYFFGLPIGRDMDGFARTDIFTAAFNAPRTITFIPTYERE